jgi:hypothetical protein
MPTLANVLGRSPNTAKPMIVAIGISRYCIGATVADGA